MGVPFDILKRDLLALVKNPIALLVAVALVIVPGLYAWYCILANWDPYSNTSSMPIAVVNEDKGATSNLTGEVNIGKQVADKLADNDSIDWRFYDDEEAALEDTKLGFVYATLVMPENLSENLLGIFTGGDEAPTVYYYPNEKFNAVATKVTDSAAQKLIRQINQGFSSTVNEKVLESAQRISSGVEQRADETNQSAIALIRDIQADLDTVVASLDDASSSIAGWRNAAAGASTALAATGEQLPAIRAMLAQGSDQLNALREKTGGFESELSATILQSAATVSNLSSQAVGSLTRATEDLQAVETSLKALSEAAAGDVLLRVLVDVIDTVVMAIEDVVNGVSERVGEIDATTQEMTGNVSSATRQISDEVMPRLNTGTYELATSFSQLSGAIGQFEPQIAALRNVLAQADSALADATGAVADAKTLLSTVSINLKGTITDIGSIGNALEIDRLSDLLHIDPDNAATFVSAPVQMVTEKIYPVSNYGTAVAPFYTNLALWIGCFILVSLMKVEVSGYAGATARQRYFGRWLLFVILSFLQSQVICGVDILLGIDCGNPVAFMAAGAVCSFAYMNLIYALVKTFRNVGRTLCILLLIMQVPGSSGMYPIEIMPGFFQGIHPMLPFTYGIGAMREALSGMYGMRYFVDLALLLLIVPVSLFIGLLLRPATATLLAVFDEEMNKVGFFASEEFEEGRETDRLRGMVMTLARHESYADDIEKRAWRFRRTYKRLRTVECIAVFAIPFAFLVLIAPFNLAMDLSTDTKLTALIIMIVLLFFAQLALVALEYTNRVITEEARLLGEQMMGDDLLAELAAAKEAEKPQEAGGMIPATAELGSRAPRGGPTRDIFVTDMKLGFQSAVGMVVIMLLVITPSMYAWFNIAGSWDPYSATGNLKVAVANQDEGYKGELVPLTINIGDTVVSQMRGNNSFDWVFVDKDEAVAGVQGSKYYAAIEIPANFSASMMTYLTDNTEYPQVVYYTNEKENPIAPLITQKGADSIQENIRVSFTQSVDEVALSIAYDVLSFVENPKMSNYVTEMSRHLDDATGDAKSASRQIRSLGGLMTTIASIVDATGVTLDGIKAAGDTARGAVGQAKAGIGDAASAFDQAVGIVDSMLDGRTVDVSKIEQVINTTFNLLELGASDIPERIDFLIGEVERLKEGHAEIDPAKFDAVLDDLRRARDNAAGAPGRIEAARAEIEGLVNTAASEVAATRAYFEGTVKASVDELRATMAGISDSTSAIVAGLDSAVSGLDDSTGGLSSQLNMLSSGLVKAGEKLESAATGIESTKARVAEALKSGDLKQIEDVILGGDPEALAANLATPIQLHREALYPVRNFGSSLAPFYTVLSLWVGALVMISTMRVHVVEERIEELRRRYGRTRPRHEFFGRYGIFGLVGLLQSTLVLLGDLLLLHIQCVNPIAFFLCGIFIGQVFCLIVYTITELFGDVGKAVCIILLIMQVAASGGTFPAQMLDKLLFNIVPYLPFYHAMSLLQECVAGMDWSFVGVYIGALLVMLGAILVIGLPLRRPFRKLNVFFEEQLEKTGFM